jgi:acyl-CoA thioester hydrolase
MITECTLQVRTYECDNYGHVNNANYLNYLEYARYEFLKAINFDYYAFTKAGYGIFVARIEIDYKKQIRSDDLLTIRTWPVKKGVVSGTLVQQIMHGTDLVTSARVTWACVDSKGIPTKIPPAWNLPGLVPDTTS